MYMNVRENDLGAKGVPGEFHCIATVAILVSENVGVAGLKIKSIDRRC